MPDKNFSRNRIRDSDRKFGEAPILGKVPRSPLSAVNAGGKLRKRSKHKARMNRIALAWTLFASFSLLSLIVVLLVGHYRDKAQKAEEAADQEETSKDLAGAFAERKTTDLPPLEQAEALAIVNAALSNRDSTAVGRHFILGVTAGPAQAIRSLEAITATEGAITDATWLGQKFANGSLIGEVVVDMQAGQRPTNRLAQLVLSPDGKWRIDLDSYLRKCVPEWPEILAGKSTKSIVRIFIAKDTYYNGIYSDDTKWQAYALVSPDVKEILYGYAKRDSPQDRALRKILESEEKIHRATVEISADPKADPRQFGISAVLAENWVIGETRFDESF